MNKLDCRIFPKHCYGWWVKLSCTLCNKSAGFLLFGREGVWYSYYQLFMYFRKRQLWFVYICFLGFIILTSFLETFNFYWWKCYDCRGICLTINIGLLDTQGIMILMKWWWLVEEGLWWPWVLTITANHQPTVAMIPGTKEEAAVAGKAEIHPSFVMFTFIY